MKTRIILFALLLLAATYVPAGALPSPTALQPAANATNHINAGNRLNHVKTSATVNAFVAYIGRYASFCRSFMPFDNDPCNHLPAQKTIC